MLSVILCQCRKLSKVLHFIFYEEEAHIFFMAEWRDGRQTGLQDCVMMS